MRDDYLWDKTGEPDAEIEHLERVLGQLRSKRTARELLPAFENLPRTRPRIFSKLLLIAASLAFIALALGLFASIQRQMKKPETSNTSVAMANPVSPEQAIAQGDGGANEASKPQQQESDQPPPVEVSISKPKRSMPESRRRSPGRSLAPSVYERERAEGLMAKEQLIKALEITSSKLNVVQKKVQGAAPLGPSS